MKEISNELEVSHGGDGVVGEDACTKDGSLDRHGKPALKEKTGGWRSGIWILMNQGLATLAFASIEVNMVLFGKSVLRQTNADASNTFSTWMGSVHFFSLIGAFLSDSYFGRYSTIVIFQVPLIIGLVLLSLSSQYFLLTPPGCGKIGEECAPPSQHGSILYYVSIYLIAIGNGAPEPAIATFGSDQFDEEDPEERQSKTSFFSYFYVALNLGSLVAETVVVYMGTIMGKWVLGFWISTCCGIVAYVLLLVGSLRYRHFKPTGNPISRFSQVIVASIRKINADVPSNKEELFEVHGRESESGNTRRILHTDGFKFLDRAAIIMPADGLLLLPNESQSPNPWRLCTITQVEEVKCILRLLPIWVCTIMNSVIFVQMLSLFVEQGAAMETRILNFHFPPASMTTFDIVCTSVFILLYDKLIAPLYTKVIKRNPQPPSELQRMGIGMAISIVAMITAAIVEINRLKYAHDGKETASLSIFWQVPQYVLVGISEAFVFVAQMEFFASQSPDGLKSLGMGLCMFSSAIGGYFCSLLLTIVMKITSRNGQPGWVPPNLNEGHLDRFFFLTASLTALNLGVYTLFARRYKKIVFESRDKETEM
ncbi:Proton-dependent oligopeptide transporter family, partial [Dillenia turbinata]